MNAPLTFSGLKPYKLSVDDYLALYLHGRFKSCGKIELLDGDIYEMIPQSARHVLIKNELGWRLLDALAYGQFHFSALIEPTIRIEPNSAPEPDIIVYDPGLIPDLNKADYFASRSIKLAIEVSVTTVDVDLGYKKALYANAGIPEYWVIEVDAARIHIFWLPEDGIYRESDIIAFGDPITSATIPGIIIDTNGLV
jgi:Uma2 family endonuclease